MKLEMILSIIGMSLIPLILQADQSISNCQIKELSVWVIGKPVKSEELPAVYNRGVGYQSENRWGIFLTGDYIYWAWQQDSLKLAELVPSPDVLAGSKKTIYINPGYTSGFQLGLGLNRKGMDDWNLYAEYTGYRNSGSKNVTNNPSHLFKTETPLDEAAYFYDGTMSSKTRINFDESCLLLKRPFYFGRKLRANFGAGLTALWITQKFTSTIDALRSKTDDFEISNDLTSTIKQKQTSWGLGPKFMFESNWRLGCGFEMIAHLSTSLLYTRYKENGLAKGTVDALAFSTPFNTLHNYATLRPITEAFLGIGWGMGLCNNSIHIGFSAGYDFNVYWNYNMKMSAKNNNPGNMYLQGLNVGSRFDF